MGRHTGPVASTAAQALSVVVLISLVGGVATSKAAPSHAHRSAARVVPAPRFVRLPRGWRQFNDAPDLLTRRGANASATALSWAYHPDGLGWAGSMPRDAIAVSVYLIRREVGSATGLNLCRYTPHLGVYPLVRKLPLRLPSTTTATLEGAPNIPEYRVFGRIGESYNFEVRVDVNNPHPSAALLKAAQSAVSAISFPRWPNRKNC
jgi:hypothetical protein